MKCPWLMDWLERFKKLKEVQWQNKTKVQLITNLMLHLNAYKSNKITMLQVDKQFCEGFILYLSTAKCMPKNKPKKTEGKKPVAKKYKPAKLLSPTTVADYYNIFVFALNEAKRLNVPKSVLLSDWMQQFVENKEEEGLSKCRINHIKSVAEKLKVYKGDNIRLKDVTTEFSDGFMPYLSTSFCCTTAKPEGCKPRSKKAVVEKEQKTISKQTASLYYNLFVCALNEAVRQDIIDANPIAKISRETKKCIKADGTTRTYLTIEEVKALIATECHNEQVKRAFLFACFCGLRISDIEKLTWAELFHDGQQLVIDTQMKKTGKRLLLPISDAAAQWIPERGTAKVSDFVFENLPSATTLNSEVKKWAKNAGIAKDIVFHTSRHTFATTLLTLGADLYTTSKLLGHQDLRTTQIYAEIVNKKKTEAVNLFNGLMLQ